MITADWNLSWRHLPSFKNLVALSSTATLRIMIFPIIRCSSLQPRIPRSSHEINHYSECAVRTVFRDQFSHRIRSFNCLSAAERRSIP